MGRWLFPGARDGGRPARAATVARVAADQGRPRPAVPAARPGEPHYAIPNLHDVELRLLADRPIMAGLPAHTVKAMRVADVVTLAQEATRITEGV